MTVRLPSELDEALESIARARGTSKHALIIEASDRFVRTESKTERVLAAIDEIGTQYDDALRRLGDA